MLNATFDDNDFIKKEVKKILDLLGLTVKINGFLKGSVSLLAV